MQSCEGDYKFKNKILNRSKDVFKIKRCFLKKLYKNKVINYNISNLQSYN